MDDDSWDGALAALRATAARRPAVAALAAALSQRQRVHVACAGDWRVLAAELFEQAAACARDGVELRAAFEVVSAFADALLPPIVERFREDPIRLAIALRALHAFVERATTAIADGYLGQSSHLPAMLDDAVTAAALARLRVDEVLPRMLDRDTLLAALSHAHVSRRGDTVLVVDAIPRARNLLATLLVQLGYRAICCASAEEGLAAASDRGPAAAIVDLALPGTGALALLAELRGRPQHEGLPIFVLAH